MSNAFRLSQSINDKLWEKSNGEQQMKILYICKELSITNICYNGISNARMPSPPGDQPLTLYFK